MFNLTSSQRQKLRSRFKSDTRVVKHFVEKLNPDFYNYCKKQVSKNLCKTWVECAYEHAFNLKPKCEICGKRPNFLGSNRGGFARFCSPKCRANSPEQLQQIRSRLHKPEVRNKIESTLFKNYGETITWKVKSIKSKSTKTMLERYGVDNPGKLDKFKKARNKTMLERYGVEHNMQSRELFEKQKLSGFKQFLVKIGKKEFKVRGYEDIALDYLYSKLKIPTKFIINNYEQGMPSIPWIKDGKLRYYHPDIYAKIKNRWWLIEVKSTYTAGLITKSTMFYNLKRKVKASVDAGFRIKVFIISLSDKNKNRYKVFSIDDFHMKTKKEIKMELNR